MEGARPRPAPAGRPLREVHRGAPLTILDLAAAAALVLAQDSPEVHLDRLRTDDSQERRRAQEALFRLGADAVPLVLRALDLSASVPAERVDELVRRLSSAGWKERHEATQALVRLGRASRPALEARAAAAPDPEVAWRLKGVLAEIQERSGLDERLDEARALAACDLLGDLGDARGIAPLLRILASPGPPSPLRLRAAVALGKLRPALTPPQVEEAGERILSLLEKTPGPIPKAMLIQTLGRLRAAGAMRPIAALLADSSEKNLQVKRACMAALAAAGDPAGLKAVIAALSSGEVYLRQGAAAVLEEAAGDAFGFDPLAPDALNREAIARFRAWGAAKYGAEWEKP